jgi:hypothetical protein
VEEQVPFPSNPNPNPVCIHPTMQLNMLESEMSAQEKAVTEKVTLHLQQQ